MNATAKERDRGDNSQTGRHIVCDVIICRQQEQLSSVVCRLSQCAWSQSVAMSFLWHAYTPTHTKRKKILKADIIPFFLFCLHNKEFNFWILCQHQVGLHAFKPLYKQGLKWYLNQAKLTTVMEGERAHCRHSYTHSHTNTEKGWQSCCWLWVTNLAGIQTEFYFLVFGQQNYLLYCTRLLFWLCF